MSTVVHTREGLVSIVTLNRPERLNAIGGSLLPDLHQALSQAQADPTTRVIVLCGNGRAFCAGDDLKEFGEQSQSPEVIAQTCADIQRITHDLMFGPKLVIGAIHGFAVGGGFEWVLNCDLVVAADDLQCFFPEMQLGHFVTGGVTHLLPTAVGHQKTVELIVMGERIKAQDLHAMGLVNWVVPTAECQARALAVAQQVAQRSALATGLLKKTLSDLQRQRLQDALAAEQDAAMACFASDDTAQRIAKRMPAA